MGSPCENTQSLKHAFYSAKAAFAWGVSVYKTPEGKEVTVTALYSTKEQGEERYAWPDKVYVGVVLLPVIRSFPGERSHELDEVDGPDDELDEWLARQPALAESLDPRDDEDLD